MPRNPGGRPPHFDGEVTKRISTALPVETLNRLDWLAAHRNETRAITLRKLVDALYDSETGGAS